MPPKQASQPRGKVQYWRGKLKVLVKDMRDKLGSEALVRCVRASLLADELAMLQSETAEPALSAFGEEVAEQSARNPALQECVAKAAQKVFGTRAKARKHILVPGARLWGRVRSGRAKQKPGRKSKVHATAIRDKVRIYLLENATQTSKLMKTSKDGVAPVYNLNASRRKLWTRSVEMQRLVSLDVWYRHLKAQHKNFVRLKCRTDICTFCHKYDKTILPALRKDVDTVRKQIESLVPPYFQDLDSHWEHMQQLGRTDVDDRQSLQYVKFLKLYMDQTAEVRMKQAALPRTVALRQQLKEAEASGCATLAQHIEALESCSHHFQAVKRQHNDRERMEDGLPQHAILVQLDFMENMTWPLGPEEAQDWFWATSRESMTTLGFYVCVWRGNRLCKENYHYISQILNHDSAYACQCLPLAVTLADCLSRRTNKALQLKSLLRADVS